jgi:hypothetical protein
VRRIVNPEVVRPSSVVAFRHLEPRCAPPDIPSMAESPLWRCRKCRREFANRNQSHACGRHDLAHHFARKDPSIRALFDDVVAAIRAIGPVRVLPEKTRIAFQVRMSFAQITPRMKWLDGHLVLARRVEHPRFTRVETFSPRNHLHAFRLMSEADIDDELRAWLAEAYEVGAQKHLHRRRGDSKPSDVRSVRR